MDRFIPTAQPVEAIQVPTNQVFGDFLASLAARGMTSVNITDAGVLLKFGNGRRARTYKFGHWLVFDIDPTVAGDVAPTADLDDDAFRTTYRPDGGELAEDVDPDTLPDPIAHDVEPAPAGHDVDDDQTGHDVDDDQDEPTNGKAKSRARAAS